MPPPLTPLTQSEDLARLKRLEKLLDRQFSVMGVKFGIDGIIGLVPVAGDVVTGALGLYLIFEAHRLGASRLTMARMFANWGIDVGVGVIPVLGDFVDIAFRSNTKNMRLLIADLEARASRQPNPNGKALRSAT